ncbi:hypothetical protein ACJX0J_015723, partial [Zea mays]
MLFKNKCATLLYAFPYLRTDMLHLTDIILFLVCAYDANLSTLLWGTLLLCYTIVKLAFLTIQLICQSKFSKFIP